ncbi:MAG TPA: hypothetical protein VI504_07990 [Candidatus Eisenbacteria bacterium]
MIRRPPSRDRRASARERLAAAVQALPELERLVLSLRLLEGLSALESAAALRVTAREVELRTTEAMRSLAQELAARAAVRRAA